MILRMFRTGVLKLLGLTDPQIRIVCPLHIPKSKVLSKWASLMWFFYFTLPLFCSLSLSYTHTHIFILFTSLSLSLFYSLSLTHTHILFTSLSLIYYLCLPLFLSFFIYSLTRFNDFVKKLRTFKYQSLTEVK
jgi:hypothetical protein